MFKYTLYFLLKCVLHPVLFTLTQVVLLLIKRQKGNCIKVGDVVVIHEENVRRVKCKLGK